jgi:hypothetical protein
MRSRWLVLLLALLCTAQLRADSITLVTGEKISGTIKSETDTDVTIEVPVSASITDERVIRKQDISKVEKEQPDEIAYLQLIKVQPNPQYSYTSETYDPILASLNAFETSYPNSTYLPDIKKLADAFQDEKKHVDAGQFKYLGQWLSKEEALRQRVQILAIQVYDTMQQQAAAGDLVGAMQTFSSIERDYGTTRSFPPAVALAQRVVAGLQQELMGRMQAVRAEQIQLRQTIAATPEPEKSHIIAQEKAQQDQDAAAIAAAIHSGVKWVPLIPRSQVSVETLQKVAATEAPRLAGIPVASMNLSIAKVDAARAAIATGDLTGADALLQQATTLWAQNEAARSSLESLKEQVEKSAPAKSKTLATPKPLPTVRPTPQTVTIITPTPAPEDKPFFMTVPGALAIAAGVLVIGGVVTIVSQRKARRQLDAE